jgi:Mn-dependent DtxR family transcriptional regulator
MEKVRDRIMLTVEEQWPVSVTEIAKYMGIFKKGANEKSRKAAVGKVIYHVKKLKEQERIRTKKIGQTVIIWPYDIEKLRVLHEMMK